ncbi:MAG: hypothetical protein JWM11_5232 [Planctomycetaceae bacterium]|nr:hypothetical protein [Planctomycetaceae bacterium]
MTQRPNLIEGDSLAEYVDIVRNQDVLAFLERVRPSCHSDNGAVLLNAAIDKCGEWIAFSPSFKNYRYVALVTNRVVFALGIGQSSVYFRLPDRLHSTALATGAVPANEIGGKWVSIELFRSEWPDPDVPFWTLRAYSAARQIEE